MSSESANSVGWVFLHPDSLPPRWNSRATPAYFVPLLPDEAPLILRAGETQSDDKEEALLRLAARGETGIAIANALGISHRSVQRRLRRIRERCGVSSKAELAAYLARRGF